MKRWLIIIGITLLLVIIITPGYLRAYKVLGDSDAPELVTGDRILVSYLSYHIRLPYIHGAGFNFRDPRPGDVVLYKNNQNQVVFKRVVAVPGTRISMKENHLFINGQSLAYRRAEWENGRGEMGSVLESEHGNGWDIYISFTPSSGRWSDFEELMVPPNSYFVLGSNRDLSEDSRHYGVIARDRILGKVILRF